MQGTATSRILLVDDHEVSLKTLRHVLAGEDYELVEAKTGRDAMLLAREAAPDLVLLDVMLPDISGFEVCREMRADPGLAEVPIVLITGMHNKESSLQGLEAGADDFIAKPVEPDELRARVRTITRLNRFRRMRDERQKYEQLVELSPDGIAVLDDSGCVSLVNRVLLGMLGMEREAELLRVPLAMCLQPLKKETGGDPGEWILHLLESPPDVTTRLEIGLTCAGGEVLPVEAMARTMLVDGRPGAQILFRDIRERLEAESAIRESNAVLERRIRERTVDIRRMNEELEGAIVAKDRFLASMSHELRTPLNSVLGLAESLLEGTYGELPPRQQEPLQLLMENGAHLHALINDVLDAARTRRGPESLELRPEQVDPVELALTTLRIIRPQADLKGQEISFNVMAGGSSLATVTPVKAPWPLSADALRLRQILLNLLSNAIKYTEERGALGLALEMDTNRERLRYTVWDQGPGVPEADRERIFLPFEQGGAPLENLSQGAGLGLALVKGFAELHGGQVYLETKLGVGSRFTVELPWPRLRGLSRGARRATSRIPPAPPRRRTSRVPAATPAPVEPPPAPRDAQVLQMPRDQRKLILLAEDRPANIVTVREFLQSHDYRVAVAANGQEAVELAHKLRPALILMDVQMPIMDGLEATREIRGCEDPEVVRIPIIALTALDLLPEELGDPALAPDAVVVKPVLLRELLGMIGEMIAREKI
jgi:PAS domain S-box-containing protein